MNEYKESQNTITGIINILIEMVWTQELHSWIAFDCQAEMRTVGGDWRFNISSGSHLYCQGMDRNS